MMDKRLYLLLVLCLSQGITLLGQTTHPVDVGGFGNGDPLPYYEPSMLTIVVGDEVQWTNSSGTHNVNGTSATFPDNPEGFYSGEPMNGPWSFSHTFTIPGTYHYHCDSKGHAESQHGTIIVESGNAVPAPVTDPVALFPVPSTGELYLRTGIGVMTVEIMSVYGRQVFKPQVGQGPLLRFDLNHLAPGQYLMRIRDVHGVSSAKRFQKS